MYLNVNLCSFSMADSWMPVNYHLYFYAFLIDFSTTKISKERKFLPASPRPGSRELSTIITAVPC